MSRENQTRRITAANGSYFEYVYDDFGRVLSSGERQRLLLARLLLRKTPIFILDEPFEFLDQEQLSRIANKVFELLNDRTLVLISHLPLGLGEQVISIQARR